METGGVQEHNTTWTPEITSNARRRYIIEIMLMVKSETDQWKRGMDKRKGQKEEMRKIRCNILI